MSGLNWRFALEVAASAGALTFVAIWMLTASRPRRADERRRPKP